MKFTVKIFLVSMFFAIVLSCLSSVGTPEGATIVKWNTSRHAAVSATTMSGASGGALAGNVSFLNISALGVTRTWAGYYGNVSGTLVLENGGGKRIYSWNLDNPGGKIMAANDTVEDWNQVNCWNWSVATSHGYHYTEWNDHFGVGDHDVDAVNVTFGGSYAYQNFYIGSRLFSQATENGTAGNKAGLCPALQLFDESGGVGAANEYEEIILQEGAWGTGTSPPDLIYVSLLEPGSTGFDGNQVDFEMIVPDNGHLADVAYTTYYFYVELEAGDFS